MTPLLRTGQFWLLLMAVIGAGLYPLPAGTLRGGIDKILHLLTYLFLYVSLDFAYRRGRQVATKLFLLLFVSWLGEIAQCFLPTRQYSWGDLLANLGGLLFGLLLALVLKKFGRVAAIGRNDSGP